MMDASLCAGFGGPHCWTLVCVRALVTLTVMDASLCAGFGGPHCDGR